MQDTPVTSPPGAPVAPPDYSHFNVEIRHDLPAPLPRHARKWPFETMIVGDHIDVNKASAKTAAHRVAKRNKWQFVSEKINKTQWRFWRIK